MRRASSSESLTLAPTICCADAPLAAIAESRQTPRARSRGFAVMKRPGWRSTFRRTPVAAVAAGRGLCRLRRAGPTAHWHNAERAKKDTYVLARCVGFGLRKRVRHHLARDRVYDHRAHEHRDRGRNVAIGRCDAER